jgi:hypothetical protein
MTDLRGRLQELADSAAQQAQRPAPAAVARRGRTRRLRRTTGIAVVLVAVAAGGISFSRFSSPGDRTALVPPASTGPCRTGAGPSPGCGTVRVDHMPARLAQRSGGPLPRSVGDLAAARPLVKGALSRAEALYEPGSTADAKGPSPVYALGSDGSFHRLELPTLDFVRDAGKRPLSAPLTATALSPDGRRAAFPQASGLLVVDLTTGDASRFTVPGSNRTVLWRGTTTVLVGQDHGSFAVDLAKGGAVTRVTARYSPGDAVAGGGPDPLVELPGGGPLLLREWAVAEATPLRDLPIEQRALEPDAIIGWQGTGWRHGDLVVRAGWGPSGGTSPVPLVAVVDLRTASVVRLLALSPGHDPARSAPLGWLDDHTVLLQTDREGVVAWDVDSGSVTSVAAPFDGVLATAP